jgi:hypothetical protein
MQKEPVHRAALCNLDSMMLLPPCWGPESRLQQEYLCMLCYLQRNVLEHQADYSVSCGHTHLWHMGAWRCQHPVQRLWQRLCPPGLPGHPAWLHTAALLHPRWLQLPPGTPAINVHRLLPALECIYILPMNTCGSACCTATSL